MTRDYIGGMEYVNDTLDAIYHSEGRIKYIDEVARYEYYIRDHLGNIRLTYSDLNADGLITTPDEIVEEMHQCQVICIFSVKTQRFFCRTMIKNLSIAVST